MEAVLVKRVTNRDLAAGVFRAWAVFWAVYASLTLVRIGVALVHDPYPNQPGTQTYYLASEAISFACDVLIFVFLMRRADWLSRAVFPSEAELGTAVGAAEIGAVVFSAIGLYFLVSGGAGCIGLLYRLVVFLRHRTGPGPAVEFGFEPQRLVETVAKTILGALILLRRRFSSGPVAWIRTTYDRTLGLHDTPKS